MNNLESIKNISEGSSDGSCSSTSSKVSINQEFLNVLKSNQNPFTINNPEFPILSEMTKRKSKSIVHLINNDGNNLKPNESEENKLKLKNNCKSVNDGSVSNRSK